MEDGLTRIIFGNEYEDKKNMFEIDRMAIEHKYLAYFKSRPGVFPEDEHDRLHHHCWVTTDGHNMYFKYKEPLEIPKNIFDECLTAFWKGKSNLSEG